MNSSRVEALQARYGLSPDEAAISASRETVYGDAFVNHHGIAQAWCGLLQPWAFHIIRMAPLPPFVVANMMDGLKLNRKRQVYHADNYHDSSVYSRFAQTWQREWSEDPGRLDPTIFLPPPSPESTLVLEWETPDGTRCPATL